MDTTMDFPSNSVEAHSRTIIHIDLDCFYAQVEMIKNPDLRTQPLGIQQKNIVVTCNYVAREFGVKKCMLVKDAQILCPKLVLVNGEDLYHYRQVSSKVTALLQKYSSAVERLGLDENYIDVTESVDSFLKKNPDVSEVSGHVYGFNLDQTTDPCDCGCRKRLTAGSKLAEDIRNNIRDELALTSCAGIAHNKLLAKLVGSTHKPDQQTVLFPEQIDNLMVSLENIQSITGIGSRTAETLSSLGITRVSELRKYPIEKLRVALGIETAERINNLCYGRDKTPVKNSGKPLSIGIEDSCKSLSVMTEVENKFKALLIRLMELVREDGRIPRTIKVTVRKFDDVHKSSRREQKQCNIPESMFHVSDGVRISEKSQDKLLSTIMRLFHKIIGTNVSFHVTLLGLAFTKFQERASGCSSIASFLMNNMSVQSVTSLRGECSNSAIPSTEDRMSLITQRYFDMNTDGSESEIEPSPKKTKIGNIVARRRCFPKPLDGESPSKLSVAKLRLNSRDSNEPSAIPYNCPPGMDESVFKELPSDVQKEVVVDWNNKQTVNKKPLNKTNNIMKYFIKK